MNTRILNIEGALLNKQELCSQLEKIATTHNLKPFSDKQTYPIPRLIENYMAIKEVYNLLNENVKSKITVHPAGEWLLDNFYAIEEVVKSIQKDMTLKKIWKISRICPYLCTCLRNCELYRQQNYGRLIRRSSTCISN